MDFQLVQEALDAIAEGDTEKATEILKHLIAVAASSDSEGDAPEVVDPQREQMMSIARALDSIDSIEATSLTEGQIKAAQEVGLTHAEYRTALDIADGRARSA